MSQPKLLRWTPGGFPAKAKPTLACVILSLVMLIGARQVLAAERPRPAPPAPPPPLFANVEWQQPPHTGNLTDANRQVTEAAIATPGLELQIYGPCKDHGVEVWGTPDTTFPMNLWTGMCMSPVAVTLRDTRYYVDLTGAAKIRWVTRAANLHAVRPVVRLADGTLLVGDHVDVTRTAPGQLEPLMVESEFSIAPIHWFALNQDTIATTRPAEHPDLSKVDAVGFADLMPGGGHGSAGWINVGEIEIFGKRVPR